MNNIQAYLNNTSNFQMNQELIALRKVFREYVVKSWIGNPVESIDFKYNKILTKECVIYYYK